MSDYELPELPSDEELGIDDDELTDFVEQDTGEKGLTPSELLAFLDEKPGAGEPAEPGGEGPKRESPKKPTAPEAPRSRVKGPLTLLALLAAGGVSSSLTGLPDPVAVNAPDTLFSSGRAMGHVVEIARDAHPTGSPEHARVRGYLLERLAGLGLEPEVQTATTLRREGPRAVAATVRNVVARLPGTGSTGAVLVTAHYDGAGISRAAADDGAGVATILEALRALTRGPDVLNDVIVLFTDGEELGLLGARAFVDRHSWAGDVAFVLALDMRGAGGPVHMFQTGAENGWAVRALGRGDPSPKANSVAVEVYRRMQVDTDFTVFAEAGMQGLNFAAIGRANVYHQAYDTPDRLSESTLQHHGLHLLGLLRHLGDADLSSVDASDAVYFTVPFLGLVVYDGLWAVPLGVLVVLLFAGALLVAQRNGARPWRVATGLGIAVAATALAYGIGWWIVGFVPRFHPEVGSLEGGWLHGSGWYVLAVVTAAFTVVTALHGAARRWLAPAELALGAATVPVGLAAAATVVAPLGAMNFQWPALSCVLAVLALVALRGRGRGWGVWLLALLLAVPTLVFLTPLMEGLWMAMSFRVAALLAALAATSLYLMLPALDALREPNAWWAPLFGLVAADAFLAIGILGAGPSAERPLFTTLLYTFDHETGEAVWVSDRVDHPADTAARAWAEAAASADFSQTQSMADFLLDASPVPVALADAGTIPPPDVVTLSDSGPESIVRRVLLGVRSQVGAELLRFDFPEDGSTRPVAINGVHLEGAPSRMVDHWGVPDSMIVLDLEIRGGGEPAFHMLEHLLRPEELVGRNPFERPPHMAPNVMRRSDRAILRSAYGGAGSGSPAVPDRTPAAGTAADTAGAADSALVADTTAVADVDDPAAMGVRADTVGR